VLFGESRETEQQAKDQSAQETGQLQEEAAAFMQAGRQGIHSRGLYGTDLIADIAYVATVDPSDDMSQREPTVFDLHLDHRRRIDLFEEDHPSEPVADGVDLRVSGHRPS
jgi:hypothetical protein